MVVIASLRPQHHGTMRQFSGGFGEDIEHGAAIRIRAAVLVIPLDHLAVTLRRAIRTSPEYPLLLF